MVSAEYLSLRDTADLLELDHVRLVRLGRWFHLAPGDPCIPKDIVLDARAAEPESRYRRVLSWLQDNVHP